MRSEKASICRRVSAPTSSPFQKARYQSAVHVTASSNESRGRQQDTVAAPDDSELQPIDQSFEVHVWRIESF